MTVLELLALTASEPSFLKFYVAATALGGAFLLLSLMSGGDDSDTDVDGDFDADVDADVDVDVDVDADVDADIHGDGFGHAQNPDHLYDLGDSPRTPLTPSLGGLVWFPFISIRFWVFALTFGGLTGCALEFFGGLEPTWTAAVAAAMGYVCGTGAVNILRYARSTDISTAMTEAEMIGLMGDVLLPIGSGSIGKVRVQTRSGSEDFTAVARDDSGSFARGERVEVVGFRGPRAVVATPKES